MNILIAGTNGFLGGRIFKSLKKKYNLYDYKKRNIPSKIDVIINLAGPDQDLCNKTPKKSIRERININKKLLKIAKEKNVKTHIQFHISILRII